MIAFWIGVGIQLMGFLTIMRHLEKNNWKPVLERFDITTLIVSLVISIVLYGFMIAHFGLVLPLILMLLWNCISYPVLFIGVIKRGYTVYSLTQALLTSGFFFAMYAWLFFI